MTARGFDPYQPDCPSRGLVDRVADRWTVLIVGALSAGPARYSELSRAVGGISPRMLAQSLKGLERDGLVERRVEPSTPPRVTYELTETGRSLAPLLAALDGWSRAHMPAVLDARERYDAVAPA